MLGKLIKNDIKASFHTIVNVYIAALAAVALMLFGVLAKSGAIKALSSFALVVIMFVIVVFTFFSVISIFNKSVYGNVGYLTLTLPVKEWQLVFSKTLTGVLFILISYIAFIVSAVLIFFYLSGQEGAQMAMQLWQNMEAFGLPGKGTLGLYFIVQSLLGLITIFFIVSCMHISVSLVNISGMDRFGTPGSILIFIIIAGVLKSLSTKIGQLINLNVVIHGRSIVFTFSDLFVARQRESGAMPFEISQYFVLLIFALCLSAATVFLIKKKINVK